MSVTYTIKPGDYLAGIAKAFGFTDADRIWNSPENTALKQLRKNGNILFAGDQLVIPDLKAGEIACNTDKQHKFVLARKPLFLRITLRKAFAQTLAGIRCDMSIDSDSAVVTSSPSGRVERSCPPTAKTAHIVAHTVAAVGTASIPLDVVFTGEVGRLDPINTLSGQEGRLSNLGYLLSFDSANYAADLKSAIEEFQCDNHLKVTGECDTATQAKLEDIHGS